MSLLSQLTVFTVIHNSHSRKSSGKDSLPSEEKKKKILREQSDRETSDSRESLNTSEERERGEREGGSKRERKRQGGGVWTHTKGNGVRGTQKEGRERGKYGIQR